MERVAAKWYIVYSLFWSPAPGSSYQSAHWLTEVWRGRNIKPQTVDVPSPFAWEEAVVENDAQDQPVLKYIQQLAAEEHRLSEQGTLPKVDRKRLAQIQVELDQCWDFLRQRRALRDVGLDPDEAEVRPPQVVENYEQ